MAWKNFMLMTVKREWCVKSQQFREGLVVFFGRVVLWLVCWFTGALIGSLSKLLGFAKGGLIVEVEDGESTGGGGRVSRVFVSTSPARRNEEKESLWLFK